MVAISSIVAKARATGVEEIIDLLCTSRVVWITKAEINELTKRGYNSRRDDPGAAYAEVGSHLVQRPSRRPEATHGVRPPEHQSPASSPHLVRNWPRTGPNR